MKARTQEVTITMADVAAHFAPKATFMEKVANVVFGPKEFRTHAPHGNMSKEVAVAEAHADFHQFD